VQRPPGQESPSRRAIATRPAPSRRTWIVAALELFGAVVLARVMVGADRSVGMGPMPGMSGAPAPDVHGSWPVYLACAVALAAAVWWFLRRQPVVALCGGVAAMTCALSQPVRVLAAQSHLIAMVELEVLMVVVPLVIVTVLPRPSSQEASTSWSWLVVGSAVAYAGVLVVIHLPAVHQREALFGAVPLWTALITTLVGVAYWFGVLRTGGAVPSRTRRAALVGAQEVAAFIGLLSLFGAWGAIAHRSRLGIPAVWDQRLGGLVMMAACAGVTIPLAKALR
jgi:hypothetical protein